MFNLTPVVKNLLIANLVVFVGGMLLGIDAGSFLGLHNIFSPEFQLYQVFTHIFAHSDFSHIFGNMLALAVFGPWLENIFGPKRFLILYFVAAFGASFLFSAINTFELTVFYNAIADYKAAPSSDAFNELLHRYAPNFYDKGIAFIESYAQNPESTQYKAESVKLLETVYGVMIDVPMVGASGAVFGLLMAFAMMFPNVELMLLFPPIPIKAKYLVAFYALYEIYGVAQRAPDDNVAHFAHIGGMIFAFFLVRHWKKTYL